MEKETETTEKISPWGYTVGVLLGSGIVVGYLVGAILFVFYLLIIIARTYIWIEKFSVFGLGWGVFIGLLCALGAIAATIVGIFLIVFVIRKIKEFRGKP
ncbi:MAG: hypothetical protein H7641_06510 [Candidatus Heimdallarchaeota archaeon]|nr:hypothetical protein [Candidatus Heimdallarchaeota archaeon]MCK4877214.1 hypothetical protein [Candidatus Heimdallarchaeota archaeon]